jgi:3-oxoacyl-[acyl-carrier protein] reductase
MSTPGQPLSGKVAIVTGAGRGIGKAIAQAYARAGAAVCCAARTETEIRETVREIVAAGGRGLAVPTDVTQPDAVRAMVKATVEAFGALDILVIDAGIGELQSVEESDPELWRRTIEVNLLGAYYCAQAAIPAMKKRGAGKIITLGSGLGHRGMGGMSAYACSKAGLWMLVRVLAQELAPHQISVNEMIPGPVVTSWAEQTAQATQALGKEASESEWVKTPEEIAPLAMFLATQPSKGPTAQSFSLMRRDN